MSTKPRFRFASREPRKQQKTLPFIERSDRRRRWFKWMIVAVTTLVAASIVGASPTGRYHLLLWSSQVRDQAMIWLFGLEPTRAQVEAQWRLRRERGVEQTRKLLTRFCQDTTEEMRQLFRVAGMDPQRGLLRWGRGDQIFLISSQVFDPDESGSWYPAPSQHAVRLVAADHPPQRPLRHVPGPGYARAPCRRRRAGAIVHEGSVQNTNSWGLRGAEPDTSAQVRGVILGDSFMQAMFNGDSETPAVYLERSLRSAWKVPISILNTGHIGYSPEQYYYSLCEYGDRMRPQFVVVSVCPNDFGEGEAVLHGEGDGFAEAEYWLERIRQWCDARQVFLLLVPVPTYSQIEGVRRDAYYPGQVCNNFHSGSIRYCNPLDEFVNEHLRLLKIAKAAGKPSRRSELHNREIDDDHFSPRGAALWAEIVGRRLRRIIDPPLPASTAASVPAHAHSGSQILSKPARERLRGPLLSIS